MEPVAWSLKNSTYSLHSADLCFHSPSMSLQRVRDSCIAFLPHYGRVPPPDHVHITPVKDEGFAGSTTPQLSYACAYM